MICGNYLDINIAGLQVACEKTHFVLDSADCPMSPKATVLKCIGFGD